MTGYEKTLEFLKLVIIGGSPAAPFLRGGLSIVGLCLGVNPFLSFASSFNGFQTTFSFGEGFQLPTVVLSLVAIVGVILIIYSIVVHVQHQKIEDKKRIISIEHFGLKVPINNKISSFIPKHVNGRVERLLLDQTSFVDDKGSVTDPIQSLSRISYIRKDLLSRIADTDKADITVVYGGLSSVPYTFLVGSMLDDQDDLLILDWERGKKRWQEISSVFPVLEPEVSVVKEVSDCNEAALVFSISYGASLSSIERLLPDCSITHINTNNYVHDNHWCKEQQIRWADIFIEQMRMLSSKKMQRVHIFIAAQNSVVFRLGQHFDNRNFSAGSIYQYDQGCKNEYPWAIDLPGPSQLDPQVRYT